jgi:small subunit ribosomal protein S17
MAFRYVLVSSSRRLPLVNTMTIGLSFGARCKSNLCRPPMSLLSSWNDLLPCQRFFASTSNTPTVDQTVPQQQFLAKPTESVVVEDDEPFPAISTSTRRKPIEEMTNEELMDTSTIPGFHLIHSPPRKFPRGALVGTVVSDKMQKTINVAVDRYRIHPKYRKRLRYTRKFMAHDEGEVARMGDVVMIIPCHRITKNKHFMLREIIRPKGTVY